MTEALRTLESTFQNRVFIHFEYVFVKLFDFQARYYFTIQNPVVKILLPKMQYAPEERWEVIRQAYIGLYHLVSYVLFEKYTDFIDKYAEVYEDERRFIRQELEAKQESVMILQHLKEEYRKELEKEVEEKMRQEVLSKYGEELKEQAWKQLKAEAEQEARKEVKAELEKKAWDELKINIKKEWWNQDKEALKKEMMADIDDIIKTEVKTRVKEGFLKKNIQLFSRLIAKKFQQSADQMVEQLQGLWMEDFAELGERLLECKAYDELLIWIRQRRASHLS